jgi:hypothetical protein
MPKLLRILAPAFLIAVVVTALAAVAAVATPAGGAIRIFGTSNGLGGGGKVLITGAIGDHGQSQSVTKSGKTNGNGNYVLLKLTQGTILLNKTVLDQKINRSFNHAKLNQATCSLSAAASAGLPIVSGTGLYTGITGNAHITVAVGFTLPRYSSGANAGKCNTSNSAAPTASIQTVSGTGRVSFG